MSNPRISLNKLAEYLQANSLRRKQIVKDAKYPAPFKTTRYSDAKNAIYAYFTSGFNDDIINNCIKELEEKVAATDFQEQDNNLSIELLVNFLDIDFPSFDGFSIETYEGQNPKISISGVDISVYPDLIIRGEKRKQNIVGAIKFHNSKTFSLDEEAGKNAASILKSFCEQHIVSGDEKVDLGLCLSVDIFTRNIEEAPKSFTQRLKRVDAACEEIALWWDNLKEDFIV